MTDIIQRSLELSIVGVDEASDVFSALADQVDAFQERFETAFAGMQSYAEDTASAIADSANAWAPEWISQLEALETASAGAFSAVAEVAATQAEATSAAWATQFEAISEGAIGTSADVTAAFGGVAVDPDSNGSAVAAAWSANLDAVSGDAVETAAEVDAAFGSVGEGADFDGDAFRASWAGVFDTIEADAIEAAAEVDAAFGTVGEGADFSGEAVAADWAGNLDKISADAVSTAADVDAAFGSVGAESSVDGEALAADWAANLDKIDADALSTAADVDAAFGSVGAESSVDGEALAADWAANLDKIDADAVSTAADVDAAFGSVGAESSVDGEALAAEWATSLDKISADAVSTAADVNAAFGSIDADGAATAATLEGEFGITAAKTGAADEEGAAGDAAEGESGLGLDGLASGGLLALIGGSLSLAGTSASISGIQGIGNLAAEMGSTPAQAEAFSLAARMQGNNPNLERLTSQLDANVQAITLKEGTVPEGDYENLGSGKGGVNTATVKAVQGSGQSAQEAALTMLFGSSAAAATQLSGMGNQMEEFAMIAEKMDSLNLSAQEQTDIVKALFGRGGVQILPTIANFKGDLAYTSGLVGTGPGSLGGELNSSLDPSSTKNMADYEAQLGAAETKLELAFTNLTPVMTDLVKAIGTLVEAIAHPLQSPERDAEAVGGVLATVVGLKAAKALVGKAGGVAGDVAGKAGGAIGDVASKVAGKAGGALGDVAGDAGGALGDAAGMAGMALDVGGDLLGPVGVTAGFLASPGNINEGAESAYGGSQYTKAQNAAMSADVAAAEKYGLNPEALIASQANESAWLPNRYQGSSMSDPTKATPGDPGRGLAQFSPSTWETDYEKTFGKAPTSDNAASYSATIQADVEAHTLKASGLDLAGTSSAKGLSQIVTGFEHPKSNTPDLEAGSAFLRQQQGNAVVPGTTAESVIRNQLSPTDTAANAALTALGKGITPSVSGSESLLKALEAAEKSASGVTKTTDTQMISDIESMGTKITTSAKTHGAAYASVLDSAFKKGDTDAKTETSAMGKTVDEAGTKITSSAKTHGADYDSATDETHKKALATVEAAAPKMTPTLDETLLTIVQDALKHGADYSTSMDTMMKAAEAYLEAHKGPMTQAGQDIMAGLLSGMESQRGAIMSYADSLAADIEATLRAATETKSPSEMTARIGEDLVAGLGAGIRRSSSVAGEAAADVGLSAAHALGSGTGGGGGVSAQPVQITIPLQIGEQVITQVVAEYMNGQLRLMGNIPART